MNRNVTTLIAHNNNSLPKGERNETDHRGGFGIAGNAGEQRTSSTCHAGKRTCTNDSLGDGSGDVRYHRCGLLVCLAHQYAGKGEQKVQAGKLIEVKIGQ